MKNAFKALGIIALAALIAFSMAACGDEGGSPSGGGGVTPSSGGRDSRLVCSGNEAWVDSYPVGSRDGFVFKADGSYQIIDDYSGSSAGVWVIFGTGSWTTSGNNTLTISGSGGSTTYSYTVTGNTLRVFDNSTSETFTKTTITIAGGSATPGGATPGGATPGGGGGSNPGTNPGGGNLAGWPPNSVLSQWGLSGMPAPTGATELDYGIIGITDVELSIRFIGTSTSDAEVMRWLTNNGWTKLDDYEPLGSYEKAPFRALYRTTVYGGYSRLLNIYIPINW